jgi:hypothetical protein
MQHDNEAEDGMNLTIDLYEPLQSSSDRHKVSVCA